MMFKITFLAAMMCLLLPTASKAQLFPTPKMVVCGPPNEVMKEIDQYEENPVALYTNEGSGIQTIVFYNAETKSMTMVEAFPNGGPWCIIGAGKREWSEEKSKGGLTS